RILEPAGDGDRTPQGDVHAGQLLRGVRRGGVDAGPGLGDDDLRELELRLQLDQIGGELVGLARGGAVADGDQLNLMGPGESGQSGECLVPLVRRYVRVDRLGRHDLAGAVDHGHLDAGPEARVEAHRDAVTGRGGEQQVT